MSDLTITPSAPGKLAVELTVGIVLGIRMSGHADIEDSRRLGDLLQHFHTELVRRAASVCRVDMTKLTFMSSACFKQFVTWMNSIEALPVEHRYKVEVTMDPGSRWQKTSLNALSVFALGTLVIK